MAEAEAGSPVIVLRESPTVADYRRALRAFARHRKPDVIAERVVGAGAIGGLALTLLLGTAWGYVYAMVPAGCFLAVRRIRRARPLRRWLLGQAREAAALGEWQVRVDGGGISWTTDSTTGTSEWSEYSHFLEAEDVFVVMGKHQGVRLFIVPRHLLTAADTEHLRTLLAGKLKPVPPRRRNPWV